ncbi:glutamate 5-kinase [Altererythrobacter arenosus]|uniref:Glutamate 5-kinase n=1 Tax=Altererythrobacter arenosus TaxID=3032592 RepID=A0ABY8FXJ4_9SPHN|nr:glutamate 5-kinase [Altererythrobacter sp. CAU 1644]WFL77976.1 glutamate 5-kinase [Altererythrobacter sp. CAU 1644]
MQSLADLVKCRRLVVKVGSALLVERGEPREYWLSMLAQDLWALRQEGPEIVVVSSGAIALGAAKLGLPDGGRRNLADAQAAAAVGQIELARLWSGALAEFDMTAAQMLVTLEDLEDRRRYLNASATLARLIEAGAIPVVNENDSVATEEIRFGDNDRLAARVAQAAGADAVLLLSDVDGLYDRDPREQDAELVERVDGITPEVLAMASGASSSGLGSGGMRSKLHAAQIAERAGITLAIINGTQESPIANAVAADLGTVFLPQRADGARKAWLGGRIAPKGTVRVDKGCAEALKGGASLLAAGVVGVSGAFQRGDLVSVIALSGEKLAQGLAEYGADEVQAIAGKRADEQAERLGYAPRSAVIHRDHMVLL